MFSEADATRQDMLHSKAPFGFHAAFDAQRKSPSPEDVVRDQAALQPETDMLSAPLPMETVMSDRKKSARIAISSDDARGALGPEEITVGDTLLPMLTGLILLTVIGLGLVAIFI